MISLVQDILQLHDEDSIKTWQDFPISRMPELISSMNLCHVLYALANSPLLRRLRRGPVERGELASRYEPPDGPQPAPLSNDSRDSRSGTAATALPRKALCSLPKSQWYRLSFYLESYGPVLLRAGDLLTGKAKYGEDVQRCQRATEPTQRHYLGNRFPSC